MQSYYFGLHVYITSMYELDDIVFIEIKSNWGKENGSWHVHLREAFLE